MTVAERIKARRKELHMSAEDVAALIGVSPSTVYRYESSEIVNMGIDKLEPIAKALRTTSAYLMGWTESSSIHEPVPDNIISMPTMRRIPLLGSIACGEPILAQENLEGDVDVPDHVHADFALRCRGDSMINARIFDGDIVYIRRQDEVDDGQIAAVLIGDEATLKRVRLYPDHLSLEPENPRYRPIVLWGEEMSSARILGLAVAFTSPVQ